MFPEVFWMQCVQLSGLKSQTETSKNLLGLRSFLCRLCVRCYIYKKEKKKTSSRLPGALCAAVTKTTQCRFSLNSYCSKVWIVVSQARYATARPDGAPASPRHVPDMQAEGLRSASPTTSSQSRAAELPGSSTRLAHWEAPQGQLDSLGLFSAA